MASYKTTSCKTVIAKAIRDFNLTGNNWKIDAIEWIGETIRYIGFHAGYEKKSCVLTSKNHKAPYPCDFESLRAVEYCGERLHEGSTLRYDKFNNTVYDGDSFNLNAFPLVEDGITVSEDVQNVGSAHGQYYLRNPDYIITSFPCDRFTIHYMAYVVDIEGYPCVPDTYEVMECMAFYILYKWLSKGNQHPQWTLRDAKMEYERFIGKAENRMAFPNIDEMDKFANSWTRMIPDMYANEKFMNGLQNNQEISNI